jgi:hypothetical protein
METAERLVKADTNTQCYAVFEDETAIILLKAACTSSELQLQSLLIEGDTTPPRLGGFSYSFPNIEELGKNLGALPIKNLSTYFLGEKSRTGESVEFFGAKLPGQAVTNWGIAILLSIAAYFYVVFRDFSARVVEEDKAWTVPWIGISSEIMSRLAFAATMLVLPSTVGYLAWRAIENTPTVRSCIAYGSASLVALSAAAGLLSCHRKAIRTYLRARTEPAKPI